MAPLFQALEDLQSSIGDTVVFPEPRLLLLHATYEWCEVRCRFTGRCVLTAFAPAICEDFAKPLENRVYGHVTCLPLYQHPRVFDLWVQVLFSPCEGNQTRKHGRHKEAAY